MAAMFLVASAVVMHAQSQTPAVPKVAAPSSAPAEIKGAAASEGIVAPSAPTEGPIKPPEGTLVDQVIGVVNGDLILESDVDQERRFGAFQPVSDPQGRFTREQAIERLTDRLLILQQAKLNPQDEVTIPQAQAELMTLRKTIPACKAYHCETDAGWTKFVQAQGFTVPDLTEAWRERMETLKFVELRFRAGIQIKPEEVKAYYDKSLVPEYTNQHVQPPSVAVLSDRIQEVLLQQRVSSLLGDWLQQLKAQGTVRMMRPDEVRP